MSSTNVPKPRSLAAQLTAWYTGAVFVLLAGASAFLYGALVWNLDREDDQLLADKVHLVRLLLRERPGDLRGLQQEAVWEPASRQYGQVYLRVMGPDGATLVETPGMEEFLPLKTFPRPRPPREPLAGAEFELPSGRGFRVAAALAEDADGARHVVQIALDRTFEESLLASYRRSLLLVLGLALLVSVLVGYRLARRGLRPVGDFAAAAARVGATTLHERLDLHGLPSELAALGATFNAMLERLEESFRRLGQFSADIAHELRTPVNNLRGEVEVTLGQPRTVAEYREVLGSSLEECGRLARLIDSLLFLARAESPRAGVCKTRLDLATELATVREFYEPSATEAGVALTVDCPEGVSADLDRTLVQRALGNLVANALAHTPAGGAVTLRGGRAEGGVWVEVADTGPGIAPEHVPHVFDRFYRADAARSGSGGRVGLGLALVKSIATLHGGTARLTSIVGQGTTVRLVLPGEW